MLPGNGVTPLICDYIPPATKKANWITFRYKIVDQKIKICLLQSLLLNYLLNIYKYLRCYLKYHQVAFIHILEFYIKVNFSNKKKTIEVRIFIETSFGYTILISLSKYLQQPDL